MNTPPQSYLNSAVAAARAAGAVIRDHFGHPEHTEFKGPTDLVTEIDRRCEAMIRQALGSAHPEVDFWGEESGRSGSGASAYWLVDPLDGTKNFVHGYPFVAVCIALLKDDRLVLGVVYDPIRDELFQAVRGEGAFLNGKRLEVSRTARVQEAIVVTSFTARPPQQKELIWKACQQCQGIRRGGASALDLCQLAAGRLDAMWEWQLQPWDLAASVMIVLEAQGTVTAIDGSAFDLFKGQVLATNTTLHRALVHFLT